MHIGVCSGRPFGTCCRFGYLSPHEFVKACGEDFFYIVIPSLFINSVPLQVIYF